jgi:uncharacterized protein YuzE
MELEVTYDAAANAAYIYLVPIGPGEAVRQEVVKFDGPGAGEIILDFNRSGQLIGIEILDALRGFRGGSWTRRSRPASRDDGFELVGRRGPAGSRRCRPSAGARSW